MSGSLADWPRALDALEERVRRIEAWLDGSGPLPDLDPAEIPVGTVPQALRVRAVVLTEALRHAEGQLVALIGSQAQPVRYG